MYISSLGLTARFYDNIYQVVHFRKIVMPNNLWVKKKLPKGLHRIVKNRRRVSLRLVCTKFNIYVFFTYIRRSLTLVHWVLFLYL